MRDLHFFRGYFKGIFHAFGETVSGAELEALISLTVSRGYNRGIEAGDAACNAPMGKMYAAALASLEANPDLMKSVELPCVQCGLKPSDSLGGACAALAGPHHRYETR